jgi:predicted nucleic acid-binding protein
VSKCLLDTNVLVYCLDAFDLQRQTRARELLRKVGVEGSGVVSTQVLQEFYVAATRKLGVAPIVAKGFLASIEHLETITVTPSLVRDAIDCSVLSEISFWDALVVVAAGCAHCDTLWTEDLNHGQVIRGVTVRNPFLDDTTS